MVLDCIYHLLDLVDSTSVRGSPATPLTAIYAVQITKSVTIDRRNYPLCCSGEEGIHIYRQHTVADAEVVVVTIGVVIPNLHAIIDQILDICVAIQKPQQLVDNTL